MPDLTELQKDKTLFEAKTEEVSLHKRRSNNRKTRYRRLSRNTNESRNSCPGRSPHSYEKEMLKGAEQAKFAKNEQLEQSMNEGRADFAEAGRAELSKPGKAVSRKSISLRVMDSCFRESSPEDQPGDGTGSADFHAIQENKEEPAQLSVMREECQKRLETIYQMGKGYLNRRRSADQTELLRRIMMAADDAQLPSSKLH